jgi:hypothetical protein
MWKIFSVPCGSALYKFYCTSRKVEGFIPDVTFFNWPNATSLTMTLGSARAATEVSTRNHPGGKKRPESKADNLTAICEPIA